MLRLGHIDYSNCFPVHALLLDRGPPDGIQLRFGVPAELNAELAAGMVDVAPASSIEYARHAGRYRLLPDLAIGSRGAVGSIVLELDGPAELRDEEEVALPTASATSVVLLRLLLEVRDRIRPSYRWFDQGSGRDPIGAGARAALWIGDAALRRTASVPERTRVDLGAAWTDWTRLPFVYALWQASVGPEREAEVQALHGLLLESRAYFESDVDGLALRHAERYGIAPDRLARYWRTLDYTLDGDMQAGLLHFYGLAAELREVPGVPEPHWIIRARD